ncbi:nucleoside hydrolase [Sistotremastrum niveocremeum HHB9708]|uniref:Nucleoside hydrolase n=1 Tax=Sistotremastrum niveocremeum HHB9708 TaxID=1314777 RepID=A0A165A1W9_9AGAM|nr:nucleoside hydrolase [Sistotremastrum niveocremeum HHB9708]
MPHTTTVRIPVIIDTDPGVDDTLALLLALASEELEILAITISFGNTDVDASLINIFKIFHTLDKHFKRFPEDRARFPNFGRPIIVARGAAGPLQGELFSAQYFHGRDGLSDITNRHPEIALDQNNPAHSSLVLTETAAEDVVLDLIRSHSPRAITYVALGPVTNLAMLLRKDRSTIQQRLGRVVSMGGALEVPGNTSPVAEFNFFADPYAVREIFQPDGIPLERFVLLPLDITTPHDMPFPQYRTLIDPKFGTPATPSKEEDKRPIHHFTSSFLEKTGEVMRSFGKDAVELHDPVAIWCALSNPPVVDETVEGPTLQPGWKAVRRHFEIERIGEFTRGMLVVDRREDEGAYDEGANRAETQAKLEHELHSHVPTLNQVQNEGQTVAPTTPSVVKGVPCVVETPGQNVLLELMYSRIWGVSAHLSADEI